ncbi:SsrA-binding protein, partial [Bacillus altitudinis]|uniref:SsrA-binding protein n=1 Tax=Bacillus altitudinis TaxID=293387 RepID=UPI0011A19B7A
LQQTYQPHLVLQPTQIKSIPPRKLNLKHSFPKIQPPQLFLHNMHLTPYQHPNPYNHHPLTTTNLLLHPKQITKLIPATNEQPYSLLPIKLYFKNPFPKLLIPLPKPNNKYHKP